MPQIGRFRKRLLLQNKAAVAVQDAEGNDITPWQDWGYVWAELAVPSVLAQSGARGERIEAGEAEQLRPHTVRCRGNLRNVITHNSRFLYGGNTVPPARIFDVKSVTDVGELGAELRIEAMEKLY
jgi:head-tail adaptor